MMIPFEARRFLKRHLWTGIGVLTLFTVTRMADLTGWDDGFYVAQLTSAVADHDLLLQDDLLAFPKPLSERVRSVTTIFESGAVQNTFSVGFAVLHGAYAWPFIATSDTPFSEGLQRLLAVGSLAILTLTALAMVRLCERWGFAPGVSRVSTGLALASGPLALFGTRVYLNSHLLSALLAALVFLGVLRWAELRLWRDALFTGLCAGLLVINRWQDALLLAALVPLLVAIAMKDGVQRPMLSSLALAALGFVSVVLLQLLAWRAQFSSWLLVPQGAGYMNWTAPALVPLLLSPYHGALPWAPGLVVGLVLAPFCASARRTPVVRWLSIGFMVALPLFIYFSAAPRDWWGGDSYGPRRLATLTPIAAIGIASLLSKLGSWHRAILSGALLLWATFTVSAYMSGFDDLWLLLQGSPGLSSPLLSSAYEGVHWIDPWGPFHALKPGFTFTDRPHNLDRLAGAAACTCIVVFVVWGWTQLRRSRKLQVVSVAGLGGWVLVCAAWLAFVIPSNAQWNERWKAVVQGTSEPGATTPFPPRVADAARLLRALQMLKKGDEAAFQQQWGVLQ
jgi:hypothetical protein